MRLVKASAHALNIVHCSAKRVRRHFQSEIIYRFKQDAFCLAQTLPYRTVSCLAKIAALGMLWMCFTCC